jgi:Xaa-Pro aminopeptidase
MNGLRNLLALFLVVVLLPGLDSVAQEARVRDDMMKLIRKEKFDLVLPGAMRDNNVDMWIHVVQSGNEDPMALDLGGQAIWQTTVDAYDTQTFYVFTDRGGDRIERAILGGRGDRNLYDIFGSEGDLTQFVAERDPGTIAVNMSDWLPAANGLTHTGYLRLAELLGDKYAKRLVSAAHLITDFRVRRVQTEIIAFAKACEMQRQIVEEALRRIKPGVTTREDLGWWIEDQLLERGLSRTPYGGRLPGVRRTEPSRSDTGEPGYIFQRGDYVSWDIGINYLNFGTDYKRKAYILKEGETDIPAWMEHAWDRAIQAREVLRKTIKIGSTASENLKIVTHSLEDAGFIYVDMTNVGSKDREIVNAFGDDERSVVTVDCHCVGNYGFSQLAEGPSIAPFRVRRADLKVQQNNLFAFEFVVRTWVPELGMRWSVSLEDNAIVTEKGVEALYPREDRIIVIP